MPKTLKENNLANRLIKDKDSYFQLASRPFTVQRFEIIGIFTHNLLRSPMLALPLDSGADGCWLDKQATDQAYRRLALSMLKPGVWEKQKNHYKLSSQNLLKVSRRARFCKPERDSLLNFFNDWQKSLDDFIYYFISPFFVEEVLFSRLKSVVKDAKQLEIISSPSKVFAYQRFQLDLLAMGRHVDYEALMKKYDFLTEYSLKETLLNRKEINRRRQEIKAQKLSEDILQSRHRVSNNRRQFRTLYKKLPEKSAVLADIIHEYVVIRTERIETYQQALTRLRFFYVQLAKFIAQTYPDFQYLDAVSLTNQELRLFLSNKVSLPVKEIKLRAQRQFALFYNLSSRNPIFLYKRHDIDRLLNVFLKEKRPDSGEIKGLIVSRGKARGRIKIIYRPDQFKSFNKGEILVSNYTSPAFMPIIKQSAAIITDEGGITSHAAIVSRELGVPCVTGTKIATKVLRDGDLVEVDADRGVIKIVGKK